MNLNSFIGALGFGKSQPLLIVSFGLIFVRLMMVVTFTPYLGGRLVPSNIKVLFSLALAIFTLPLIYPTLEASELPAENILILFLFLKEAFFGLLLAVVNLMVFYALESVGSMIDNQRYVANARIFNPSLGAQTSIFGVYIYQLAIAIFISIGGHRYFLKAVIESFLTVPLLTFPHIAPGITPMIDLFLKLSADTLVICLQLSAPVLIAIFIADLVLGITNRIAPMINVFEMGFNIKGFVGVLLVYLSLPVVIFQMKYWFQWMAFSFGRVAQFFAS